MLHTGSAQSREQVPIGHLAMHPSWVCIHSTLFSSLPLPLPPLPSSFSCPSRPSFSPSPPPGGCHLQDVSPQSRAPAWLLRREGRADPGVRVCVQRHSQAAHPARRCARMIVPTRMLACLSALEPTLAECFRLNGTIRQHIRPEGAMIVPSRMLARLSALEPTLAECFRLNGTIRQHIRPEGAVPLSEWLILWHVFLRPLLLFLRQCCLTRLKEQKRGALQILGHSRRSCSSFLCEVSRRSIHHKETLYNRSSRVLAVSCPLFSPCPNLPPPLSPSPSPSSPLSSSWMLQ